jgi:DNA-binding protein YbaB
MVEVSIEWLNSSGAVISTTSGGFHSDAVDAARQMYVKTNLVSPNSAVSARVEIEATEVTGHNAANFVRVYSVALRPSVPQQLSVDTLEASFVEALNDVTANANLNAGGDANITGQLLANGGTITSTLYLNASALRFSERVDPGAPAANNGLLYVRDNGAGKSQLCIRFPTGAVQVIATEP